MTNSSTKGILVSIALFSFVLISFPANVYGEEISVTSIALEETSILELTNNSKEEVKTLRVWVGSDFSFKSFKTEEGWVGEKTPQGVIIFTSSETIKLGESVKFGVITDKSTQKINWKALDNNDLQIAIGASIAKDIPTVVKNSIPIKSSKNTGESMSSESSFRIVPKKPNVSSTIRVTGDNFGASHEFDFYIDSKKLGSFVTDANGHFMTTMKIPDDQKAERVILKVIDKEGKENTISLKIGEVKNRIPKSTFIPLTIKGIPDVVQRGDFLEIFGTGNPNSGLIAEVHSSDDSIINSRTMEIDSKGNWKLDEPIIVPFDIDFGRYSVNISDGRESIVKYWTVESDKVILVTPTKPMFKGGELIIFNGTALPNIPIDLVLEDSHGNEMASDSLEVNNSGLVGFQYQTTKNIDKVGTWTLIAKQGQHKELIYVGYDEIPSIPVSIELDKLNYKSSETAHVSIIGIPSEKLSMIIVSPSGHIEGNSTSIQLGLDGRAKSDLKLTGFRTGIYEAVIKKGSTQSSERFTVGLQTGSGEIDATTTKSIYLPGESILLLGKAANFDSLFTAILFDPNGQEIKVLEFPSDDKGKFTENKLRIPSNGISGTWLIKVASGPNFFNIEIEVLSILEEGILVNVEFDQVIPGFGTIIKLKVEGAAPKSSVSLVISDANGDIIDDSLKCNATNQSTCNVPWTITENILPGTYTVKVTDSVNYAENTFVVD